MAQPNHRAVVRAGPGNYVFPPYVITDAGEPLDHWLGAYPSDGNRMFLQCGLEVPPSRCPAHPCH